MKKVFLIFPIFLMTFNSICFSKTFTSADEMIQFGLSRNKSLEIQKEIALTKIKSSKLNIAAFLPQLDFSWNEYNSIYLNQNDTRTKSISLSATQLIFDNGKSKADYVYNRFSSDMEYIYAEEQEQQYILSLREKFFNWIYQKKNIELKKEFLENSQSELEVLKFKFENGLCTKSDYLEYEILISELKNEIKKIEYSQIQLTEELKQLLYLSDEEDFSLTTDIFDTTENIRPLVEDSNKLIEKAVARNSSLSKQNSEIEYYEKILKIRKRCFLPTISFTAGISFSGKSYPLNQPDYTLNLKFSFDSLPWVKTDITNLLGINPQVSKRASDSFSTAVTPELNYWTNNKISKLTINQMKSEKEKILSEIKTGIKALIYEHDYLIGQISQLKNSIKLKKEKYTIFVFQNEKGLITTSDLIKEKINLEQDRQSLLKSEAQLLILQNKIQFLTGEVND